MNFRHLPLKVYFYVAISPLVVAAAESPKLSASYGQLPIVFERNVGQADSGTSFIAHGTKYSIRIHATGAVLNLSKSHERAALTMEIGGADPHASTSPLEPLASYSNYYVGNDPSKWLTGVPQYGRVRVSAIHPGVDIEYYGTGNQLEYDSTKLTNGLHTIEWSVYDSAGNGAGIGSRYFIVQN